MIHMQAAALAVRRGVAPNDGVLDHRIPEVDAVADLSCRDEVGRSTLEASNSIENEIVLDDGTIAVIECDAPPVVQDGGWVADHIALDQNVLVSNDTDIAHIGKPVVAHNVPKTHGA